MRLRNKEKEKSKKKARNLFILYNLIERDNFFTVAQLSIIFAAEFKTFRRIFKKWLEKHEKLIFLTIKWLETHPVFLVALSDLPYYTKIRTQVINGPIINAIKN